MTLTIAWPQALAWRLDRHLLATIGNPSIEDVVNRLCGVQSQVPSSAELAIRVRQSKSKAGDVGTCPFRRSPDQNVGYRGPPFTS